MIGNQPMTNSVKTPLTDLADAIKRSEERGDTTVYLGWAEAQSLLSMARQSPGSGEAVAMGCRTCNSPRAVDPCPKCGTALTKPADGWEWPGLTDIDRIRELARQVGYAVAAHGSMERDQDLIAVPWVADAVSPAALAEYIADGLGGEVVDADIQDKLCGRWACNIHTPEWTKLIDLSVMPPVAREGHASKALKTAIEHIEHMAAFIGAQNAGYSFESIGEDMPGLKAALSAPPPADTGVTVEELRRLADDLDGVMERTVSVEHPKLPREGCMGIAFRDGNDYEVVERAGKTIRSILSRLSPTTQAESAGPESVFHEVASDGSYPPNDQRRWLARKLMDSKLTDAEAYSIVRCSPTIAESAGAGQEVVEAAKAALAKIEADQCHHETTHRGGVIWTICDECNQKWADDEGGFQPYVEPPYIARLRAALSNPVTKGEG